MQHQNAMIRCLYHLVDAMMRFGTQQGGEAKEGLAKAAALLTNSVRSHAISALVNGMSASTSIQFDGASTTAQFDSAIESLKVTSRCGELLIAQFISSLLSCALNAISRLDLAASLPFRLAIYFQRDDPTNRAHQLSLATALNKTIQERRNAAAEVVAEVSVLCKELLTQTARQKLDRRNAGEAD